jgi:hypothetical protein
MPLVTDPVSAVAGVVQSIINEFPNPEQKAAANQSLANMYLNGRLQQMTAQAGVITAEASSGNKLTSSWRPMLMYVFMAIIANNYIVAPYLHAMFGIGLQLDVPPQMWTLIQIGVGGYVGGRTIEKVTTPHPITGVAPLTTAANAIANVFKGNAS